MVQKMPQRKKMGKMNLPRWLVGINNSKPCIICFSPQISLGVLQPQSHFKFKGKKETLFDTTLILQIWNNHISQQSLYLPFSFLETYF